MVVSVDLKYLKEVKILNWQCKIASIKGSFEVNFIGEFFLKPLLISKALRTLKEHGLTGTIIIDGKEYKIEKDKEIQENKELPS